MHVADAVQKGFRKVHVCAVNTDVMVLVIAAFELWIAFGTGSFIIMISQKEFVLLESRLLFESTEIGFSNHHQLYGGQNTFLPTQESVGVHCR